MWWLAPTVAVSWLGVPKDRRDCHFPRIPSNTTTTTTTTKSTDNLPINPILPFNGVLIQLKSLARPLGSNTIVKSSKSVRGTIVPSL